MSTPYAESWLAGSSDTQIYTHTYTPSGSPRAVVVFMHGFAEHIGRYTHFHPRLAARGVAVFAFDQRGFGMTALDEAGKKSVGSSYGKTSWKDQAADIAWAVQHVQGVFKGIPVFLMGHSMGGGEVLGFATLDKASPYYKTIVSLSGIIATSPLLQQTTPAAKALRWTGGKMSVVFPSLLIPAKINVEWLSHDPAVNERNTQDPFCRQAGSLRGIHDMLTLGDTLLSTLYQQWPNDLPLLVVHGTDDKITSYKASQAFFDKLPTMKKKIVLFPDGYHELQNEPGDVQGKLADIVISFIDEYVTPPSTKVVTRENATDQMSRL